MDKKLFVQAIGKYLSGVLLLSILLFVPAGTLKYWNAWLLMGILFIPMFIAGVVLMIKNPELLRKRLNSGEKETEQKHVIISGGLMFICIHIIAVSVYAAGAWFFVFIFCFSYIPCHYG
jgi:hypothetical protein